MPTPRAKQGRGWVVGVPLGLLAWAAAAAMTAGCRYVVVGWVTGGW